MKIRVTTDGTVNSNNQSATLRAEAPSGGTRWSLRFWQGILGAAFLCLLLVCVALFRALPAPGRPFELSAPVSHSSAPSLTHYLQSGQWRADVRTLASMFHYLVTPETVTTTNRPVLPA